MALLHVNSLFVGNVANASYQTVYTVPAGQRVVVRSLVMNSLASASCYVSIGIGSSSTRVLQYQLTAGGTPGSNYEWRPWLVLGPGVAFKIATESARSINFALSGSVYDI